MCIVHNSILNLDEQNIMESIAILFCFAWSDHLSFCFSFSFKMIILILYSISIVGIMLYLLISCSCVDQSLILKFLVFFFLDTMITSIISLIHNYVKPFDILFCFAQSLIRFSLALIFRNLPERKHALVAAVRVWSYSTH